MDLEAGQTVFNSKKEIDKEYKQEIIHKTLHSNIPTGFHLICTGQIESIQYPHAKNLYCRYCMAFGPDWRIFHGSESGFTQISANHEDIFRYNFPIDISFESTNPFGWPRFIICVYGPDMFGRDVVKGYGCVSFPTYTGIYTKYIPLFTPISSSFWQSIMGILCGKQPEYFDAKFISQGEGREFTRVASNGNAKIHLQVTLHGMKEHGYTTKLNTS